MTNVEPCYKMLGKAIDRARREQALSNAKLAELVGVSRPSMVNMLAGRQRIYLHHVLKLEKIMKVDLLRKVRMKGLKDA